MFYKGMTEPVGKGDSLHAAIEFAWKELSFFPDYGSGGEVEFYRADPNAGERRYAGSRSESTDEGYSNLSVEVRRPRAQELVEYVAQQYEGDCWIVDVATDSRDCDGRYLGGYRVIFAGGQNPYRVSENRRDLSAEAAGF